MSVKEEEGEGAFTTFLVLRASGTHNPEALVAFSKLSQSWWASPLTYLFGASGLHGFRLVGSGSEVSVTKRFAPESRLLYLCLQTSFINLFFEPSRLSPSTTPLPPFHLANSRVVGGIAPDAGLGWVRD